MADWTDIANESIEPDAPAISSLFFALRDNPKAIAEGASGAPRIVNAALASNSVTNVKVANGTLSADKFQTTNTERNWVLARTAAAAAGAVGTYALLATTSSSQGSASLGSTFSGNDLRYANIIERSDSPIEMQLSGTPSGTWRLMSTFGSFSVRRAAVFLRIS